VCAGILCSTQRAATISPSQPSFWTPGRPQRNLSITSLPSPALRKVEPGMSRISGAPAGVVPSSAKRWMAKRATACSWILPKLWLIRVTSMKWPRVSTIFHHARLSSAVPQSSAFLPPAFIAMLPPMHEASAEVGSTAKTRPAAAAASATRAVTTPAPVRSVVAGCVQPGSTPASMAPMVLSFSVLITAAYGVSGTPLPV